jgi:hypothetical protein
MHRIAALQIPYRCGTVTALYNCQHECLVSHLPQSLAAVPLTDGGRSTDSWTITLPMLCPDCSRSWAAGISLSPLCAINTRLTPLTQINFCTVHALYAMREGGLSPNRSVCIDTHVCVLSWFKSMTLAS